MGCHFSEVEFRSSSTSLPFDSVTIADFQMDSISKPIISSKIHHCDNEDAFPQTYVRSPLSQISMESLQNRYCRCGHRTRFPYHRLNGSTRSTNTSICIGLMDGAIQLSQGYHRVSNGREPEVPDVLLFSSTHPPANSVRGDDIGTRRGWLLLALGTPLTAVNPRSPSFFFLPGKHRMDIMT